MFNVLIGENEYPNNQNNSQNNGIKKYSIKKYLIVIKRKFYIVTYDVL